MEQLTFLTFPYRYIIDTSSLLTQKPNAIHRRQVFRGLWERIDDYIRNQVIVTCSEILEEVRDTAIRKWLSATQCVILDIDEEVQLNVRRILREHPEMINLDMDKGGSSSGDAFLIATAMKHELTVITEENKTSPKKIPMICNAYEIECVNIAELCEKEKWNF